MIARLTTLLFGTFFASISAFSQFAQSFDVAKQLNPAMAGLEYKISANVMGTGGYRNYGSSFGFLGNYAGFNSKYKIGYSFVRMENNYVWNNEFSSSSKLDKFNINKQFNLGGKLQLSTGVGVGLNTRVSSFSNNWGMYGGYWRERSLQLETGIALKNERLSLGLSGGYQLGLEGNPYLNQLILNVSAAYTFGHADGLQFTPQFIAGQAGLSYGGTFSYKSKFTLGGGLTNGNSNFHNLTPYITAGYTIRDKFKINYTYNFHRDYGFPAARHAVTLSFQLGKK